MATIDDMPEMSSTKVLDAFVAMKGSYLTATTYYSTGVHPSGSHYALLNTADAAALITWKLDGRTCGRAYDLNAYKSGQTFSVTEKSCASGAYTFSHEIAHNFGCGHNPEKNKNRR